MATGYVTLIDAVTGNHIAVNSHQIRYLRQLNPHTVQIYFDNDHILPVNGEVFEILGMIERPEDFNSDRR